jgi:hypothetical protein
MPRAAFLIPLLALSCSEQKFHTIDDVDGAGSPAIQVDPGFLNFGMLGEGEESIKTFTISSVGEEFLEIETLRIESEAPSFTILTDVDGLRLPVGEYAEIDVVFTPMASHSQSGQAIITSNAAGEEEVAVELIGDGSIAELQIFPDPLDMGVAYVGCDNDDEIELRNVGTDALEIYEVNHEGSSFDFDSALDLPLTLEPDESVSVYLNFEPEEEGEANGTLTVTSSEPLGVREAIQTGTGQYATNYEQEWEVAANPPSDIVFYVDQSCSMEDDQARLAEQFSTFITELNSYSTDWQIIVANQDNGCNQTGGVLRPGDSDYATRFQSAVSSGGGFWTEAGLTISSQAIDLTDAGECNAGFMRPGAMLHIIMVSDESEQSTSSWGWYVDKVVAKKGSSTNVKFSAIAGDWPGGCATADPGEGYHQAVSATSGVFLSICSDWAIPTNLSMLAAASVQQAAFELDSPAAESTIKVYLDGDERTSGWHFDEGDNVVIFDTDIPEEGQNIRITYGGIADCEG